MTEQYPDPEVIDGPVPSDSRSVRAALRSVRPAPLNMNRVVDRLDDYDRYEAHGGDPVVGAWTTEEGGTDA